MAESNTIPEPVLNAFRKSEKYDMIKSLGYGAYGIVYLVFDKMTQKEVAAKVVARATTNEKKIWPSLYHPNILTLIRTDEIILDAVAFITPNEGHDLFYLLYEKVEPEFHDDRLCFVHKRKYMLHVLKGLEYLHSRNLCHLDLREENILIRKSNVAVIGDFSTLVYSEQVLDHQFGLHTKALPPEIVNKEQISCDFDGTAAEMWTYGILVLQVFTKQFISRHTQSLSYDDYLPQVLKATESEGVLAAFDEQHCKTYVSEAEKSLLFRFIENFIVKEPKSRKSAKAALAHTFMEAVDTNSELHTGEDLDSLIKLELDGPIKNRSFLVHLRKSFSKMSMSKSQADLKSAKDLRKSRSVESISHQIDLTRPRYSPPPERTSTLPKNFLVQSDTNFFKENRSPEEVEIVSTLEEMSIVPNISKSRPLEKSILTNVNCYTSTGEISQAVLENHIGDCMPQTSSAKWTDSFAKFFSKPKLKKSKCEGEHGIENPIYNVLTDENGGNPIQFTAKGQVCEKPKRQWYWRLRAFGRMFSRGKLFKKRQKKDIIQEDKLNLM